MSFIWNPTFACEKVAFHIYTKSQSHTHTQTQHRNQQQSIRDTGIFRSQKGRNNKCSFIPFSGHVIIIYVLSRNSRNAEMSVRVWHCRCHSPIKYYSQTKYYLHSKIYNIGKSEWQTLLPLFDESFTWQTEVAAAAAAVVVE